MKALSNVFGLCLVLLLGTEWFRVTNIHKVILTWHASSSPVAGYNVYRKTRPDGVFMRVNSSLIQELTFTDNSVGSGDTYYYVTRSVGAQGTESANSNEIIVTVP